MNRRNIAWLLLGLLLGAISGILTYRHSHDPNYCDQHFPIAFFEGEKLPQNLCIEKQLLALATSDAKADAQLAWDRKDERYVGTMGTHLTYPGVDDDQRPSPAPGRPKIIVGTSDVVYNQGQMSVNYLADIYAEKYNLELKRLMTEAQKR